MKRVLLACTLLFASTAFAQDSLDPWIKMLKEDLKAQKKEVITQEMKTFTPEEAKRFQALEQSSIFNTGVKLGSNLLMLQKVQQYC